MGRGETRITLRARALALVKVMPDSAHQAIGIARETRERTAEHFVGKAVAINVRSYEGPNAMLIGVLDNFEIAFLTERLAKMHIASAAPSAKCGACHVHNLSQ